MATQIYHTPPRAFLKAHTAEEIEEMFALLELEEDQRNMARALHATE